MKITHSYQRQEDYLEGEYVIDTAVGVDTGTTNYCLGRLSRLAPNNRYVVENIAVVDLHDENRKEDIDTIGENLRRLFSQSDMQWFWEPPSPVTSERQLDGIQKFNSWKTKSEGGEKPEEKRYKPPIMFAIYGMTQQIVCARTDPALLLSDDVWDTLIEKGIPVEDLKREGIVWVPRTGGQKSYLKGTHDKERKLETLTAGPRCARDNGDEEAAIFLESLPRQKPREDACDIVLQIHHYLEERRTKEEKAEIKEARLSAAEAKREEKAQKAKEREEKARQRKEAAEKKAKEKEERKQERERKQKEKAEEHARKLREREARKAAKEAKEAERQRKKTNKISQLVDKTRPEYDREMNNKDEDSDESTDNLEVRVVKDHSSNKRKRQEVEADEEEPVEASNDASDPPEASEEEPISERPAKRQKTSPQPKASTKLKTIITQEDDSSDLMDFDLAHKLLS